MPSHAFCRPQVTLYGNDQGANNVLDSVERSVGDFFVQRIPGLNVPVTQEAVRRARHSAAVVLGFSGGRPEALFARDLLDQDPSVAGSIVFVEDFPRTAGTEPQQMKEVAPAATACTILSGQEQELRQFGYRDSETVGAPDHWVRILENMSLGMEARRNGTLQKRRRGSDERLPVLPHEKIVYVSGFYDPVAEQALLSHLLDTSGDSQELLVHFRAHPGEKNRPELQAKIAERDALLRGSWEIADEEIAQAGRDSDGRLAGAADVIVAHPGATITNLTATYGKHIVAVLGLVTPAEWKDGYDYRLAERTTHLVERTDQCRDAIHALLRGGSQEQRTLAAKQAGGKLSFDPKYPFGTKVAEVVRKVARR